MLLGEVVGKKEMHIIKLFYKISLSRNNIFLNTQKYNIDLLFKEGHAGPEYTRLST